MTPDIREKNNMIIFNNIKLVNYANVNPDGVTISQYGPKKIRNATLRKNLYKIANGFSFKEWKANARGVDINRNYAEGFNREGARDRAQELSAKDRCWNRNKGTDLSSRKSKTSCSNLLSSGRQSNVSP